MRIILTGGGTSGNIVPAISIAEALRAEFPDVELLFVGTKNGPEAQIVEKSGIRFKGITSRKLKRSLSPDIMLTMASLFKGFLEASAVLREFKPALVIGTGGYASAAVVMAQSLRRGKTIITEADSIPGRTNRWLSRFAGRICVACENAAAYFPKGKTLVTGWPIRQEFLDLPEKNQARGSLGMKPDVFTLLVLGGSQGAKSINQAVIESIPELRKLPIQVLHQVGPRNFEEVEPLRESADWDGWRVCAYIENMRNAYAAADLALIRSGSTIYEITVVGLPAILVPYPYAHADHQRVNAEYVAGVGGGIIVKDSDLNAEVLISRIKDLIDSPDELKRMSEAGRKLGRPDAAKDIANLAGELMSTGHER